MTFTKCLDLERRVSLSLFFDLVKKVKVVLCRGPGTRAGLQVACCTSKLVLKI